MKDMMSNAVFLKEREDILASGLTFFKHIKTCYKTFAVVAYVSPQTKSDFKKEWK